MVGAHYKLICAAEGCKQSVEAWDSDTIGFGKKCFYEGWRSLRNRGIHEECDDYCPDHATPYMGAPFGALNGLAESEQYQTALAEANKRIQELEKQNAIIDTALSCHLERRSKTPSRQRAQQKGKTLLELALLVRMVRNGSAECPSQDYEDAVEALRFALKTWQPSFFDSDRVFDCAVQLLVEAALSYPEPEYLR